MHIRLLVAFALVAAACSGAAETTTTVTSTPPTTTAERTTTTGTTLPTTTIDDRPTSPINGLAVDDPALLERRVLAVKIDNHRNARPQTGILEADAVFEILVEGGLTRFMTVFHSADAADLGPIRSGRPSDAALVRPLEAVLTISGGQPWIRSGINAIGVQYLGETRPAMYRFGARSGPHNLYGATPALREAADERGYANDPPPTSLWNFGEAPSGEPAETITFRFSDTTTTQWTWSGSQYERSIDGGESNWVTLDGETERISVDLLLAIVGDQYVASPPGGQSGSSVPATSTIGTGPFYLFQNGEVVAGTWEREDASTPFTLTTEDGAELLIPAGKPWISVIPDDRGDVSWQGEG